MEDIEKLDYEAMYKALRTKIFQDKTDLHRLSREAEAYADMSDFLNRSELAMKIKKAAFSLGVWKTILKKT